MSKKTRLSSIFFNDIQVFNEVSTLEELTLLVSATPFFKKLENELGHQFRDPKLLVTSLIHRSFAHEIHFDCQHNEKLEFLGDSVLQLVVSEKLFKLHPDLKEGKLSKLRSSIVNETSLSEMALSLQLDQLILLGKGELKENGHQKPSLLANLFEAILGAVYLDSHFQNSQKVLEKIFASFKLKTQKDLFSLDFIADFDAKSKLQEECLRLFKTLPSYEAIEEEGLFHIVIKIKNQKIASIKDISKKKGMQKLAKLVLDQKLYQQIAE